MYYDLNTSTDVGTQFRRKGGSDTVCMRITLDDLNRYNRDKKESTMFKIVNAGELNQPWGSVIYMERCTDNVTCLIFGYTRIPHDIDILTPMGEQLTENKRASDVICGSQSDIQTIVGRYIGYWNDISASTPDTGTHHLGEDPIRTDYINTLNRKKGDNLYPRLSSSRSSTPPPRKRGKHEPQPVAPEFSTDATIRHYGNLKGDTYMGRPAPGTPE